jgi:hypothetical protein
MARRPRSFAAVRLAAWCDRAARAGLLAAAGLLAGCVPAGAPSLPFFGAYFPSWLACALIGILGAVALRFAFIRAGIDDAMPARLPVYVSIAAAIGFLVSIIGFGR